MGPVPVMALPLTVLEKPRLLVDTELLEFVCLENEKDQAHMVGK